MAERLVGTWQCTLRLERPLSLSTDASKLPRSVVGTVALLETRGGKPSFDQMDAPTHVGVYVIDLGALGFSRSPGGGVIPGLVARTVRKPASAAASVRDSLFVVINPQTPDRSVRLSGTFDGDSASGVWVAESLLGGGGTFTLRRGTNPPAPAP
jgi:hypothetical protein